MSMIEDHHFKWLLKALCISFYLEMISKSSLLLCECVTD